MNAFLFFFSNVGTDLFGQMVVVYDDIANAESLAEQGHLVVTLSTAVMVFRDGKLPFQPVLSLCTSTSRGIMLHYKANTVTYVKYFLRCNDIPMPCILCRDHCTVYSVDHFEMTDMDTKYYTHTHPNPPKTL